jgi:myosin heavy subunit
MSATDQLWFRHPTKCWSLGDIKQFHGKDVELREVGSGALFRVLLSETHPCDASHMHDADDLAHMNNMHEAPLLSLLERRYMADKIYTLTGDILISINPYRSIEGLYDIPQGGDLPNLKELRVPHVFMVADKAYKNMLETADPSRKNQSIIVSGESGAGKTEAAKHTLTYLATLSQRHMTITMKARQSMVARSVAIERKVLDCNPFLEAFGNAKTLRNDNSSRFGKFLKIEFEGGRILGARMRHYLLEKARVVCPGHGERNYHVFYQLCRGATEEERAALRLGPAEAFSYLVSGGDPLTGVGIGGPIAHGAAGAHGRAGAGSPFSGARASPSASSLHPGHGHHQGHGAHHAHGGAGAVATGAAGGRQLPQSAIDATYIAGVDDGDEFEEVRLALASVGIGSDTQAAMWAILAGLLHLGNVRFNENGKEEAGIANGDVAATAAALLGVPGLPTKLVRRLVRVKGRASAYEVNLTAKQAVIARDSLAKSVYERLFTWLIAQCNRMLSSPSPSSGFIGVLDIFGFEIFDRNSFEQLCINYCNEKCVCCRRRICHCRCHCRCCCRYCCRRCCCYPCR